MKQITDAYNAIPVPETVLNEAVYDACIQYQRKNRIRVSRVLITVCLVIALTGGTALALRAELREFVISFFKTEQVEAPVFHTESLITTLPDGALNSDGESEEPAGYFLGQQEIEGIAQVRYFKFSNGFDIFHNNIMIYDGDGNGEIYGFLGEDLTGLEKYHIDDVLHINGYSIPLNFTYVIDNGFIKTFDNVYDFTSGGQASAMDSYDVEYVWVGFIIKNEYSTILKYNLKTGEYRDIIKEAGVDTSGNVCNFMETWFSPDNTMILVNGWGTVCLIDAETMQVRELTEIYKLIDPDSYVTPDGIDLSVGFIDNKTLTVWQYTSLDVVRFSVYWYDIESGVLTNVFEDTPFYSPNAGQYTGVSGLDSGFTLLVEPDQYILVNDISGDRFTVNGLTPHPDIHFMLSPDRKLVSVSTMSNQNGFGITQLGCINIAKQELKVFDRVGFSDIYEWSMGWMSNNELVVLARIGYENKYMYVYQFE